MGGIFSHEEAGQNRGSREFTEQGTGRRTFFLPLLLFEAAMALASFEACAFGGCIRTRNHVSRQSDMACGQSGRRAVSERTMAGETAVRLIQEEDVSSPAATLSESDSPHVLCESHMHGGELDHFALLRGLTRAHFTSGALRCAVDSNCSTPATSCVQAN